MAAEWRANETMLRFCYINSFLSPFLIRALITSWIRFLLSRCELLITFMNDTRRLASARPSKTAWNVGRADINENFRIPLHRYPNTLARISGRSPSQSVVNKTLIDLNMAIINGVRGCLAVPWFFSYLDIEISLLASRV